MKPYYYYTSFIKRSTQRSKCSNALFKTRPVTKLHVRTKHKENICYHNNLTYNNCLIPRERNIGPWVYAIFLFYCLLSTNINDLNIHCIVCYIKF